MLISTLNCEMWPNFSYRGVRSVQLLLLLLLLMVFSSENFGFSPPYAGIAGIGPVGRAAIHIIMAFFSLISIECQFKNEISIENSKMPACHVPTYYLPIYRTANS